MLATQTITPEQFLRVLSDYKGPLNSVNFRCTNPQITSIAQERMLTCLFSFSYICQNKLWEVLNLPGSFENGLDQERQRILYESLMESQGRSTTNPEETKDASDKYLEMCTRLIADEKMLVNVLKHNYRSPFTAEYLSQNMRPQDPLFLEKFRILVASPFLLDRNTIQHLKEQVLVKLRNEPKMSTSDINLYLSFFFKNSIQNEIDLETLNLLENSSSSVLMKEILVDLILQNLQRPRSVRHAYQAIVQCDTAGLFNLLQAQNIDRILKSVTKILKEIKQETAEDFGIIVHCIGVIKKLLSKTKYWIGIGQKETLEPLYKHAIAWIQDSDELSEILVRYQLCKSVKVFHSVQELIKDHLPMEEDQKMHEAKAFDPTADDWGSFSQASYAVGGRLTQSQSQSQ